MAHSLPLWTVRIGALLGAAAFFIPQWEYRSAPGMQSPYSSALEMARTQDLETAACLVPLLMAPFAGSLLVLASTFRKRGESPFLRWALVSFFFFWAFALATLGSILATQPAGHEGSETATTLLHFAVPLALATVVGARVLGGSEPSFTASITAASIGLLILAEALHLLQSPNVSRWGPGALVPVFSGAQVAAGAILALCLPRPADPGPTPPPAGT